MGLKEFFKKRKEKWDSVCSRCGLCCYEKGVQKGRYYINLDRPCRCLDVETEHCLVYEERFRICKECGKLRMHHALFATYLSQSCAYVQKYRPWRNLQPGTLFKGSK